MANKGWLPASLRGLLTKWGRPGILMKSAWLHKRHPDADRVWVSWDTKMDIKDGARFDIAGYLTIGFYPKDEAQRTPPNKDPGPLGPPIFQDGFLDMSFDSVLRTTGSVFVGPGCHLVIGERAELEVGEGTYLSGAATILARRSVTIGKNCAIGWHATIMDSDMHFLEVDGEWRPDTAPVTIEDGVWLGSDVRILKGITIGEGAVVATGAVVTNDVEPHTLVGGVPATVLRKKVHWY